MPVPRGLGHITLGDDFAKAADYLFKAQVKFRHYGPVEYNFCHSLELLLKGGLLLAERPENEVETFGHQLLKLYDEARTEPKLNQVILDIEKTTKDSWRERLQKARDTYQDSLGLLGHPDPDELQALGVFDNNQIGNELPKFRDQVIWMDSRHKQGGGLFRYHQVRCDRRNVIHNFGLSDDIVLQSMSWGCNMLADRLVELTRRRIG